METVEPYYGIAFLTIQNCISGVTADYKNLSRQYITKRQALEKFDKPILVDNLTVLMVCDAVANYYKHKDEWDIDDDGQWKVLKRNRESIEVMKRFDIDPRTESTGCGSVASRLITQTNPPFEKLVPSVLLDWAKTMHVTAKQIRLISKE
jgi:hypothetical protein